MAMLENYLPLLNRSKHYKSVFLQDGKLTEAGRAVLADLAKFGRQHSTTTVVSPITRTVDPIASAQAEGRREAYLRILWHLKIDDADLIQMTEAIDYE